jgi:hypothetical protein
MLRPSVPRRDGRRHEMVPHNTGLIWKGHLTQVMLSLLEAPDEIRSHSSRSKESSDIVSPMIWKVSHDTSGGTQFRDRSVPDTLDRLDHSDESRTMPILSTPIHFADLSSAAKVIASLIMILRRVKFYPFFYFLFPHFGNGISFYGSLPQTPQGTQFLDLFHCESSAKFLQNSATSPWL